MAEQSLFLLFTSFAWGFNLARYVNDQGVEELPSLDPSDWGTSLASPPPINFKCVITPRSKGRVDVINATAEEITNQ